MIKLKDDVDSSGLYKSQVNALNQLSDWWASQDLECVIKGFAGTGKTYLIKYFLDHVVNKTYTITAPTHKALTVLESSVGVKGMTLQSLHGLKPNTELSTFDIDNLSFESIGTIKIQNYSLIVIDEGSMIPKGLFQLNRQRALAFNVKILYLGDNYQLPPVNEKIGSVFTEIKTVITLDTIIRQDEDNALLKLFPILRSDIDNKTSNCLQYIVNNPKQMNAKEHGYQYVRIDEYKELLIDYFSREAFYDDIEYVRSTAYTNITVSLWNKFIRERIFETEGNPIIMNDLITSYKTLVDDNNNPILINSQDYIIQEIRKYTNEFKIKVYCVIFKSVYSGKNTEMLQILDVSDMENVQRYMEILNLLREKALKIKGRKGWFPYFKFKNQILSMIDVTISSTNVTREIDYGYCLTTHKLQGSTYDNIFIDGFDICSPITKYGKYGRTEIELRNRLLYVALSRARSTAIIRF